MEFICAENKKDLERLRVTGTSALVVPGDHPPGLGQVTEDGL